MGEATATDAVEIIESRGVRIPFHPQIVTPVIERPLRKGKYEGGECLAVEAVVGPGDRVLELGSGLGLVSTIAAMKDGVGEVRTFEANPDLIPVIRETHQLNNVVGKIEVTNGVVTRGDAPPKLTFYRRPDFWASSLSPNPGGVVDTVDVATHDLDQVLATLAPTVIVSDIEGGELDLFEGADLSSARYVIMEIHPRVYGAEGVKRIFDYMSDKGFGYSPKISRGGTVVTFERVKTRQVEAISSFAAPAATPVAVRPELQAAGPRVLGVTCMKNEGPYILEWIAYHRAIGVTDFVVFTNDCKDGTELILQRLDDMGVIRHLPNPATALDTKYMQPAALAYAELLPQYAAADYVLSFDVDEFVNIQTGDGTIAALLDATDNPDAISMTESLFACDGHETFEPGWVTEQFTMRATLRPGHRRARRGVKTLWRRATGLTLKNHRPFENAQRSYRGLRWVDGSGNPAPAEFVEGTENGMDCRDRYDLVRLNHYALRSMEGFLIKRDRGDVVIADKQVSRRYWRVRNHAEEEDQTILSRLPAARTEYDRLIADPVISKLHQRAIDWHRQRIAHLRGEPDFAAFLEEIRSIS